MTDVPTLWRAMILRNPRPAARIAPDPRPVHRPGNGGPGIVRALFGMIRHRPVEGDRPLGAPGHPAVGPERAGADAARHDIDRDRCCTGSVTLAAISSGSRERQAQGRTVASCRRSEASVANGKLDQRGCT
jgi:hypothetical protein